jgi:hypothetical protein
MDRLTKFRASFSVLSTWESGNWQRAIDQYFKLDKFTTPQMEMGKRLHQEFEKSIKTEGKLPDVFGGHRLTTPQSETKIVIPVSDWMDFVCIPDCVDGDTLYEFKTGAQSATDWANTWQVPIYGYALLANKTPVTQAKLYAYNQYNQQTSMAMIWITPELMQRAVDKMYTLASSMWDYLQKNRDQLTSYIRQYGQTE